MNVKLDLPSYLSTTNFYLLELGELDAVLGVKWLRALSPILWDFSLLTMTFGKGKKLDTLNGKKGTVADLCSQKHSADTLKKRRRGVNMAKPPLPLTVNLTSSQQQQLEAVLSKYQYVFQPPQTLPPARIYDHRIPLKEGFFPLRSSRIATLPFRRMKLKSRFESFYSWELSSQPPALTLLLFC